MLLDALCTHVLCVAHDMGGKCDVLGQWKVSQFYRSLDGTISENVLCFKFYINRYNLVLSSYKFSVLYICAFIYK